MGEQPRATGFIGVTMPERPLQIRSASTRRARRSPPPERPDWD